MWASKTLGLVVMEIKVKGFFLTILSFDVVTDRLFHSPKRVEMGYAWNAWKTTITRYVIRAFMKKEWLKAAKIISSKWIFWKFVSEMGTNPSPYLPSKVTLPQLLISLHLVLNYLRFSAKRETDVLDIPSFLPASDSLFGSRLIFKQSYLTVEWLHLRFQRNGNRETSN